MVQKLKYSLLLLLIITVSTIISCKKEIANLPAREVSPEVAEIVGKYKNVLEKVSQGWFLSYKPDQYEDTLYFQLFFKENGKIDILSGYRGHHHLQEDIEYYFEGNYTPVIVFSGENVFTDLAESYNGSSKFKIYFNESLQSFELVRSDGFDDKRFKLIHANDDNLALLEAQIGEVLAQIEFEQEQERLSAEVKAKVKTFVEIESDFYFYNLSVGEFSAAINSFDTTTRTISLTYKESPISAPKTSTLNYRIQPEGLALEPAISYGTVHLALLELGELIYEDSEAPNQATSIEIRSNSESGGMGYAHVAPYPYTNINDRSKTVAQILHDMSLITSDRILYANVGDTFYSPKALQIREAFRQSIVQKGGGSEEGTLQRFNFQIYLTGTNGPSFQLATRNIGNTGNIARVYYLQPFDTGTFSQNIVKYALDAPSSVIANESWVSDFKEMILQILPEEEGVTVVPYTSGAYTRFRLVSRKDSRIWVNYIHQNTSSASPSLHKFD